jgi:16S rRNA (adenine1518-N6/adenine1519-N6)-dimethyltransferase
MNKCHFKLTKRLGQHLLVDQSYLRKVIDNSELQEVDLVLEVGPGTGNLTELLIPVAKKVLAVELDRRFCEALRPRFCPPFQLFEGDILAGGKLNPDVLTLLPEKWALVANLPYNVAGPILIEALFLANPPKFMCVTIQKEVAQRMAAPPDSKTYGVLSILIQAFAQVKILSFVPPGAFLPPPKVHSAIVKITSRPDQSPPIHSPGDFRKLVSRIFQHRRKTLRAGWIKMLPPPQQQKAAAALAELNIDPTRRPETLSVQDFITLANLLSEM